MTIYSNPNDGSEYSLTDHKSGEMICTLKAPKAKRIKWPSKYANLGKRLEEFVPYGQAACLAESSFVSEEAEGIARDYEKLADIWAAIPDATTSDPSSDKVWLSFFSLTSPHRWYMTHKPNRATGDHARGHCIVYEGCNGSFGDFVFNDVMHPEHSIMHAFPMLNVDSSFEPILYSDFKAQLIMDKIPADDELG